jgi:hypothetical protein
MEKTEFDIIKEYTLQGVPVWQHELTIGQDIELAELVTKLGNVSWRDFSAVLKTIQQDGFLGDFLQVILEGEVASIDPLKLTNSQVSAVAQDFFDLNGTGIENLRHLFGQVISIPEQGTEPMENSKTS